MLASSFLVPPVLFCLFILYAPLLKAAAIGADEESSFRLYVLVVWTESESFLHVYCGDTAFYLALFKTRVPTTIFTHIFGLFPTT